ncbi:MAG: type II toxin-antitoxin system HicA family toxin [Rikenellaceae bacterium]|nr:type II toxin-antitoxin system HicA family toxin [Rikenellaceae bacterium]
MKSSELHRLILRNGWTKLRQARSHITYEKNGHKVSVPSHGAREMGMGMAIRFIKEMGLK